MVEKLRAGGFRRAVERIDLSDLGEAADVVVTE